MKRALLILALLLLSICLVGIVAARTVLRPRMEMLPSSVSDNGVWRCRVHTIRQWSLEALSKGYLDYGTRGFAACGPQYQQIDNGWQYGPFAFEERQEIEKWPVAVEVVAREALANKPWAEKASLAFRIENDGWHVTVRGPKNESLEMIFTEEGKPVR